MIVELSRSLFSSETLDDLDDVLLLEILRLGMHGRFGVKTRPAFRKDGGEPINRWIAQQSPRAAETATRGLERGLQWKEYSWPKGRLEPRVIIESKGQPDWPRSFDEGPARLALGQDVERLLRRPLRLKLENEINDRHFLERTVPAMWRKRWRTAMSNGWIEPEQGGGISEIRRVLINEVAADDCRRLRLWVMFDSDATGPGDVHEEAERTRAACEDVGVPYHMLERRMIENYVPEPAMRGWVTRVQAAAQGSNSPKAHEEARRLVKAIEGYWALPPDERHFVQLKAHEKIGKKYGLGGPADIWRQQQSITESDLSNDGWDGERSALFLSLFASL
ncbi:MAG: hypothetical protein R6X02_14060 [Enhygromyxa sp.]